MSANLRRGICVALAAAGVVAAPSACRNPASAAGTALRITVNWTDAHVFQLSFSAATGSTSVLAATVLPSPEGVELQSPQSVLVELKDNLGGDPVVVHVDGLAHGQRVASGDSAPVTIQQGLEVDAVVALGAGTDGGTDGGGDAGPGDAGSPDAGVDAGFDAGCLPINCGGCCTPAGACIAAPMFPSCGADAGTCNACDTRIADRCSPSGDCTCGDAGPCTGTSNLCFNQACTCGLTGAPCAPNEQCGADSQCHCGTGPSCGDAGLACANGSCHCTPASCPGCCEADGGCSSGTQLASCGVSGAACQNCSASSCADGGCTACNPGNCSGCCANGVCNRDAGLASCGSGAVACAACDLSRSNACAASGCACGTGSECDLGLVCDGGACQCTSQSCANGCCQGGQCFSQAKTTCGIDAGACVACDPIQTDSCSDGRCACGDAGPCGQGLICQGGTCQCTTSSCAFGCCQGNVCQPGNTLAACGVNGGACITCDSSLSDGCTGGSCTCAGAPECSAPKTCRNICLVICTGVKCQ